MGRHRARAFGVALLVYMGVAWAVPVGAFADAGGNIPPVISDTVHTPPYPTEDDQVNVTCLVVDDSAIEHVLLFLNIGTGWAAFEIYDDGKSGDGAAGDDVYGVFIPPLPDGTQLDYFIRAEDDQGALISDPANAPIDSYQYVVGFVPPTPPVISDTEHTPQIPMDTDVVNVTTRVEDDTNVQGVWLWIDAGDGWTPFEIFDDGNSGDGGAGDSVYGALIPPLPDGTRIDYYVSAVDDQGSTAVDPPDAPIGTFFYIVGVDPNQPPTISNTTLEPAFPQELDPVTVRTFVQDDAGVDAVVLWLDVGGGWFPNEMFDDGTGNDCQMGDNVYTTIIPPLPLGTRLDYFIGAADQTGLVSSDPPTAPDDTYFYVVGAPAPQVRSPVEDAVLSAIHVLVDVEPTAGADHYQIQVATDDLECDPFMNPPVVDVNVHRSRHIVKEGLEFGRTYAWRMRPLYVGGAPGAWQDTHRFSIVEFPDELVGVVSVNNNNSEEYQPGLTLAVVRRAPSSPQRFGVAVDQSGGVVWFLERPMWDLHMLRNGNIMYVGMYQAEESALDGTIVWQSSLPVDVDKHEAFDMPNGNVLLITDETREVLRDGDPQNWRGHNLIELTRDGDIVWNWNTFDHISTLDFDECFMQFPDPSGDYDWIHGNSVVYDAVDRAVYFSARHLSRIVKIDYDTGNIVYNMGFDMPSGEADFGDDFFSFQHAPHLLPNGNMMVYDNGNRRGHSFCDPAEPYSSALELRIEPGEPEPVTVVWQFDQDFFTPSAGDADRLPNGNTLITAGINGRILEVTSGGEVVWELTVAYPSIMYRGERILSLYPLAGDADGDDDVDLRDFGVFQQCFRGTDGFAIHRDCLVHDFDEDGDVDLEDYAIFREAVVQSE